MKNLIERDISHKKKIMISSYRHKYKDNFFKKKKKNACHQKLALDVDIFHS